jgi:hypothetical protein
MYKVDIKTLEEITKTLDELTIYPVGSFNKKVLNARLKAKKLSQNIKDNYTKIKP